MTPGSLSNGGSMHQKRSEEHTSELQSQSNLVCRLLLEKTNVSHFLQCSPPPFPALSDPLAPYTYAAVTCIGCPPVAAAAGRAAVTTRLSATAFGFMRAL